MSKNRRLIAALLVAGFLAMSSSADAMLKLAVLFRSPDTGISIVYHEETDNPNTTAIRKLYWIDENVPIDQDTKEPLHRWCVYTLGVFHVAFYFGEG